ncbi:DNA-3-methyladenine glycosylase [Patescibacteria group bacterium]|nr:DNA-3-methyladenine glycosylase [Patescibacteria group bacterium]MDE1946906.1 DNA-3-methyladenine glycosylase [Patescibacteria group bacterium]MDE2011107.1 DNA-3-methyladenine glycosylase [Patescibacteria group bacterium]MDE2233201.1 DNA-3-methyladenine glycosylase [Patescibacteria group bacterium]
MINKVLTRDFFNRSAVAVARKLLGCILVRKRLGEIERFIITETEAYDGFKDRASHASRGKTARNRIMFKPAGHIYVYFTYGMHWMLNIVTGPEDYPAAVLIRGATSLDGEFSLNGPARLTKKLGITGALNGKSLGKSAGLWIERAPQNIPLSKIKSWPRIGVAYAGPVWAKKKWRFTIALPTNKLSL